LGGPKSGQDKWADLDALGVEFLDQLPAVPLFVRNEKEVPSEDSACQMGQPVGDLRDRGAGVGGQGDEWFFRRLILGVEGADRGWPSDTTLP
jgi:hypothetical protein